MFLPLYYLCWNINNITGLIKEIKYMHVIKKIKKQRVKDKIRGTELMLLDSIFIVLYSEDY